MRLVLIVLSVLLRFTDSDNSFGIFKLFLIVFTESLRYQRDNRMRYIEGQTIHLSKEKEENDKQRSTQHYTQHESHLTPGGNLVLHVVSISATRNKYVV